MQCLSLRSKSFEFHNSMRWHSSLHFTDVWAGVHGGLSSPRRLHEIWCGSWRMWVLGKHWWVAGTWRQDRNEQGAVGQGELIFSSIWPGDQETLGTLNLPVGVTSPLGRGCGLHRSACVATVWHLTIRSTVVLFLTKAATKELRSTEHCP